MVNEAPPYLKYLMDMNVFETPHSGRTLGVHLVKTHDMMVKWGCPDTWCKAGLFHSVYGTEFFTKVTTDRDSVKKAVGEKVETLVYLFCELPKKRISFLINCDYDQNTKMALLAIAAANSLEQGGRSQIAQYMNLLPPRLAENIALTEEELRGPWEVPSANIG